MHVYQHKAHYFKLLYTNGFLDRIRLENDPNSNSGPVGWKTDATSTTSERETKWWWYKLFHNARNWPCCE